MSDEASNLPEQNVHPTCDLPPVALRELQSPIDPRRARLIRNAEKKWVNGTILNYHFLDSPRRLRGATDQKDAVRNAFRTWKELGIGLEFREVDDPERAEIRIGFDQSDGSWSYVGRDAIDHAPNPAERTMNFGWDLTTPYGKDTALHEIGHALGFPHEHQNPNAGIVWDEPAVYAHFAGPPNRWSRKTTYHNIIRQLEPGEVDGSNWDRNSIMHYSFNRGLISQPPEFRDSPLVPEPGLSNMDIAEVRRFYPSLDSEHPTLDRWQLQRVVLEPGEQLDWSIRPNMSRTVTIQTFGELDTVLVLFEKSGDTTNYVAGDDDGGGSLNAQLKVRLVAHRHYVLRLRLYSNNDAGGGALLMY